MIFFDLSGILYDSYNIILIMKLVDGYNDLNIYN